MGTTRKNCGGPKKAPSRAPFRTTAPKISLYNSQKKIPLPLPLIRKRLLFLLEKLHVETSELIVYFVTPQKISKLHKQFFDDPSPTDCISFPLDPSGSPFSSSILGEIFVCPAVAAQYAKTHEVDLLEEIFLYIVHGLLHILGYDDQTPKDRKKMRRAEKSALNWLRRHFCRF